MKLYIVAVLLIAAVACTSASPSKRSKNAELHHKGWRYAFGDQLNKRGTCPLEGYPCFHVGECPSGCRCDYILTRCTSY